MHGQAVVEVDEHLNDPEVRDVGVLGLDLIGDGILDEERAEDRQEFTGGDKGLIRGRLRHANVRDLGAADYQ